MDQRATVDVKTDQLLKITDEEYWRAGEEIRATGIKGAVHETTEDLFMTCSQGLIEMDKLWTIVMR